MANRNFKRVQSLNNETKIITGRFSVASGVATKIAGIGFSVAGTGTGEFTITLEDSYPTLLAATATVEEAGGVVAFPQVESHDVVTAKTVVLNTVNASGAPAAADCAVHFVLMLNNSTVA